MNAQKVCYNWLLNCCCAATEAIQARGADLQQPSGCSLAW
jgi:hypothetical protein